jgi:alanine racemase
VRIDPARVRANAIEARRLAGVDLIAVIKGDAYGLGGRRIAEAIHDVVDAFYVFEVAEAIEYGLERFDRPVIALRGDGVGVAQYIQRRIRPVVWSVEQAAALREARPILCVDTGQQRFAAPPDQIAAIVRAGDIHEAFTHAIAPQQAQRFAQWVRAIDPSARLHAAGSSLLHDPQCRFDAVRPGLALYRGAVEITVPLVEARDSAGPVGYTGFTSRRHGVILAGYSHGLRPGPCLVNGQPRRIVETGMQTAFVELEPGDGAGDIVTLLGEGVALESIAAAWRCGVHEPLARLCASGVRE